MKKYKLFNTVFGWVAFAIAAFTYLMTIEPTASFWDCGEFISTAYKLDVGHPPGAPFFMLCGRVAANFAGSPETVAKCLNALSALFSALTILFLFWTITALARKIVFKDDQNPTKGEIIGVIGAGLVGSLAYTFSDTFWFSAVEGEVYAFSSLFTAVVFWAILKWDEVADEPYAARWIVFIAFLTGLSIGVHLLNLLCIPAITLVYYYRKSEEATIKGAVLALLASFVLVAIILFGIVPGFVNMAGWFDLLFVNTLHLPFNSGAICYIVLMAAAVVWGIIVSRRDNEAKARLALGVNLALAGIPFVGSKVFIWILLLAAVVLVCWKWKALNPQRINTTILCLMVILIGYGAYGVTVIRSNAQPPMDQNSPDNMFSLERYLNREQYGERPLLYGETFASEILWKREGNNCVPQYEDRGAVWNKSAKSDPADPDHYEITGHNERAVMAPELNMIFPRMYSSREDHVEAYKMWSDFKGKKVYYDKCGEKKSAMKPTMAENLRFFFSYQVNYMYWRYFMWNFSGRQNDIQGTMGDLHAGNWITGIPFIDRLLVGDLETMPEELKANKGYNRYYMLPLLLGIIGLLYQVYKGKKGLQGFWVTFFLFFMTGLAIILYLNQTPNQPRERDYAYAGSFYAFCIWIGLAVPALIALVRKVMPESAAALSVTLCCLGVPALMASENWDDHDRSNRFTCRDFAYNYLVGCDENAIIFTNGDNDTFPLWYIQEVEGFRTDVRVCNLSYLQTDWYYSQMLRPYYDSEAFPVDWEEPMYKNGKRDVIRLMSLRKDSISLDQAMRWAETDDPRYKRVPGYGEDIDYIPSKKIYMPVDKEQVLAANYVEEKYANRIVKEMNFNYGGKTYIGKHEFMLLKLLQEGNWERPLYFAVTVDPALMNTYQNYFIQEGLTYKVAPVSRCVDSDKMFDNLVNRFRWGNIQDPKVYLDENNLRMCRTQRQMFGSLIRTLVNEKKYDKAQQAIDRCFEVFPKEIFPVNFMDGGLAGTSDILEALYKMNKTEEARDLFDDAISRSIEGLEWVCNQTTSQQMRGMKLLSYQIQTMQTLLQLGVRYDADYIKPYIPLFNKFVEYFRTIGAA